MRFGATLTQDDTRAALSRAGLALTIARGRPIYVAGPERGARRMRATLAPSPPSVVRIMRAIVPAFGRLDPRVAALVTAGARPAIVRTARSWSDAAGLDTLAAAAGRLPKMNAAGDIIDTGALAVHVQLLLSVWAKGYPAACVPSDYGATPSEFTGTDTARTRQALKHFQIWWNAQPSAAPILPTDGGVDSRGDGIDLDSYEALQKTADFVVAHRVTTGQVEANPPSSTALAGGAGLASGLGLALASLIAAYVFRKDLGL